MPKSINYTAVQLQTKTDCVYNRENIKNHWSKCLNRATECTARWITTYCLWSGIKTESAHPYSDVPYHISFNKSYIISCLITSYVMSDTIYYHNMVFNVIQHIICYHIIYCTLYIFTSNFTYFHIIYHTMSDFILFIIFYCTYPIT